MNYESHVDTTLVLKKDIRKSLGIEYSPRETKVRVFYLVSEEIFRDEMNEETGYNHEIYVIANIDRVILIEEKGKYKEKYKEKCIYDDLTDYQQLKINGIVSKKEDRKIN